MRKTVSIATFLCFGVAGLMACAAPLNAAPAGGDREAIYGRAKKELPADLYAVYRIIDRIARANGLDETPWRVIISPKYDVNAFASEINLISMFAGMLDQMAGDPSAVACVVGHEMAHHVKRHIPLSESKDVAVVSQVNNEVATAAELEAQSSRDAVKPKVFTGALLQGVGQLLGGGIGGLGAGLGGHLLGGAQQRLQEGQQRIQQLQAAKEATIKERRLEISRNHEFEADRYGYEYMARAGFEPEGCLRTLTVLSRIPGSEFDSTHPAVPRRIEVMKGLFGELPAATLMREGKSRLDAIAPLSYSKSQDGKSLRINSRKGGSTSDSIDRMFR